MLFSVRLNNWFLGYYIIQTNRNLSSWATFKHKHQQCSLQSDSLHHIKLTLQSTKVPILCSGMILHWRSYSNQFKSFLLRCPWGLCPIKKLVTSMSKKDKMADGAHRRLCVSDGPASKRPIFAGRGRVILGLLADRLEVVWEWTPTCCVELSALYIYTEWLSKYSVQWCS